MYERNQIFADRAEAGRRLAERLAKMALADPVVLALPRGGVPVGYEIARRFKAPLDVLLVRKIGAPDQEEFALGALVESEPALAILNEGVPARLAAYIKDETARQAEEIERRRQVYRSGRPLLALAGRTVIVVDDGIATGATFRAALEAMKHHGAAKIIAAIPVAPPESLPEIVALSDEIVCLATPEPFQAVGLHYGDFSQVGDDEVVGLLRAAREWSE